MWVLVHELKILRVWVWDQARASIFTHQKFISPKIAVHISVAVKGAFPKYLEALLLKANQHGAVCSNNL